ncbi:MAG: hypothetical protein HYU71_15775 [Bacteroidetes bacterium]|nr:hypothetical protein [Bacteroidota bacterium]
MRIDAVTKNPSQLLHAIQKAIKDGTLKTWEAREDDKKNILYTHVPEQWVDKALIQLTTGAAKVSFTINWWANKGEPSQEIKGYYIGRFTEILLVHFRNYFDRLETYA